MAQHSTRRFHLHSTQCALVLRSFRGKKAFASALALATDFSVLSFFYSITLLQWNGKCFSVKTRLFWYFFLFIRLFLFISDFFFSYLFGFFRYSSLKVFAFFPQYNKSVILEYLAEKKFCMNMLVCKEELHFTFNFWRFMNAAR